jgi:regulator of RNase E activity RraA
MRPEIRPVLPGRRVCGPAVTSLNHAGDNVMLHAAIDVAQRGDVIVVATTSPCTDGMLGECAHTTASPNEPLERGQRSMDALGDVPATAMELVR